MPVHLDHELAVEHELLAGQREDVGDHLGEVAVHRLAVAALQVHVVAVAEHDRAEAVPLRLVAPAVALGQLLRGPGELGLHGRFQRKRDGNDLIRMWLVVESGPEAGQSARIEGQRFSIGSGDGVGLRIEHDDVDAHHATIAVGDDGHIELRDEGSREGVFVEGERVTDPVALNGDEKPRAGNDVLLRLSLEEPAVEPTAWTGRKGSSSRTSMSINGGKTLRRARGRRLPRGRDRRRRAVRRPRAAARSTTPTG